MPPKSSKTMNTTTTTTINPASYRVDSIAKFVEIQKILVKREMEYETAETAETMRVFSAVQLQRRGVALLGLGVTAMRTGLGGSTLLDLEPTQPTSTFPPNRFKVGDIVTLEVGGKKTDEVVATGVVARMRDAVMTVAVKEDVPDAVVNGGGRFRVTQMGNEVTYKRMLDAMNELQKRCETSTPDHVAALMGMRDPTFESTDSTFTAFDVNLNPSQIEAVKMTLCASDVALIHGPPGTGKTQTVVEVIRQLVGRGERVLVCGPSNTAVDTLVERLSKCRLDIARIGHPARVKKEVLDHALEVRVRSSDEGQLVADVRTDLDRAHLTVQKAKGREKRREAYAEVKALRNELRNRERTVVSTIIRNAQVVLSTLSGAASMKLKHEMFDTVVIDEGSQAVEAECWIALLKAKKVILAGDHKQLPPTVKSNDAKNKKKRGVEETGIFTLELTLFDRLLGMYGDRIKRLLNVQYRMHERIMAYPSQAMYHNSLIAHESVSSHLLSDLPSVNTTDETVAPLLLINTSEAGLMEDAEGDDEKDFGGESLLNRGEAEVAVRHVRRLVEAGVAEGGVAVISPYGAQIRLLRGLLREDFPGLEIGTVDSFQGGEREAIILSLVRSNDKNEIGFLQDSRRLNVAITRARRHLCVIANVECMTRNPFLKGLFEYMEEHGDVEYAE